MHTARPPHEYTPLEPLMYTTLEVLPDRVIVARSPAGVCAVFTGDDDAALLLELQVRFPHATLIPAAPDSATDAVVAALTAGSADAASAGAAVPLDLRGTAFQQDVWRAIRTIPLGQTATYRQVAALAGRPTAVRAVASACAANAVAVIIPCHRVVRADGGLGGYRWGVARKERLLEMESRDPHLRRVADGHKLAGWRATESIHTAA